MIISLNDHTRRFMLTHYTSIEGFNNIIVNDNLRLTRSEFMNDPSDSKMFGEMIDRYLEKSKKQEEMLSKYEKVRCIYTKVPVMDYIRFVQKRIHLYVLSFTNKSDEMEFWNYYGNGGAQLNIHKEDLLVNMANRLENGEEYLACAPVIYVKEDQELKNIQLKEPLAQFDLREKNNESTFKKHMQKLDDDQRRLYKINNVQKFVDFFVNDYFKSLDYLLNNNRISTENSVEEIMDVVFQNQVNQDNAMIFKKDFLIYMILLSALIKTDSYEYENETRIVYFENSLSKKSKQDQYELKTILGQKYIRPYVEFDRVNLNSALDSVVVSPLTRNIPIDDNLYKTVIEHFLHSQNYNNTDVNISKHKCRW